MAFIMLIGSDSLTGHTEYLTPYNISCAYPVIPFLNGALSGTQINIFSMPTYRKTPLRGVANTPLNQEVRSCR